LTFRRVFRFSAPLAATWLMMPVEGAFLASVIARLVEPKFNLAAFGVAFSFAMLRARAVMHITAPRRHTLRDYGVYSTGVRARRRVRAGCGATNSCAALPN
jgi:hypothetical protein